MGVEIDRIGTASHKGLCVRRTEHARVRERHADALGTARLQRRERTRDGRLERLGGIIGRDHHADAPRRDAGRPVRVERLALLQHQLAFGHGLADEAGESRRQGRVDHAAGDQNERVDIDAGEAGRSRDLMTKVHNSPS